LRLLPLQLLQQLQLPYQVHQLSLPAAAPIAVPNVITDRQRRQLHRQLSQRLLLLPWAVLFPVRMP
jgi:hypothetical protein